MRRRIPLVLALLLASLLVLALSLCNCDKKYTYVFEQNEYVTTVGVAVQLSVLDAATSPPTDITKEVGVWSIDPDQDASVSPEGLFTATKPGRYSVKAMLGEDQCRTSISVSAAAAEIFNNGNGLAIDGGGTPPSFQVSNNTQIIELTTYHDTISTPGLQAGTITLQGEDGKTYGPFQSSGSKGQGGDANAYWIVKPDHVVLPPGRYTIIDSDPQSFAQNAQSGGVGMAWLSGTPVD